MDGNTRSASLRVPNAKDGGNRASGDIDDDDEAHKRPGVSTIRYRELGDA